MSDIEDELKQKDNSKTETQTAETNKKEEPNKKMIAIAAAIIVVIVTLGLIFTNIGGSSINYTYADVGEKFTYDGLEITIESSEIHSYAGSMGYSTGNDNELWFIVNVSIYNPTTQYKYITKSGFLTRELIYSSTLYYRNKNNEETHYNGTVYYDSQWIDYNEKISPYNTLEGIFTYKVPRSLIDNDYLGTHTTKQDKGFIFEFSLNKQDCKDKVRVIL